MFLSITIYLINIHFNGFEWTLNIAKHNISISLFIIHKINMENLQLFE